MYVYHWGDCNAQKGPLTNNMQWGRLCPGNEEDSEESAAHEASNIHTFFISITWLDLQNENVMPVISLVQVRLCRNYFSVWNMFFVPPPHNHLATPGNWLASPLEVRTHRMRTACLRQRTQHKRVLTSMQTLLYASAVKILLSTHFYPLTAATCLPASSGDGILKLLRAFKLYHQGPVDGCCRGWLLTYLFPISSSLFFRLSLYLFPSLS